MFKISGQSYKNRGGSTSYSNPEYIVGYNRDGIFECIQSIEYNKKFMKKARELAEKCFSEL
jgi:hypothetical protein